MRAPPHPCQATALAPAVALVLLMVGCRLGRPPVHMATATVGEVRGATVEPTLAQAVADGLGTALARQGHLGPGPAIHVEILRSSVQDVAIDAQGRQVRELRLRLRYSLDARSIALEGRGRFSVGLDPMVGADARTGAFSGLAGQLAEDAVHWFAHLPPQSAELP
jgi:hypothetical protein